MKIETKLSLNYIKKNSKRSIFTIISIALCTFLILTTLLIISSIQNGIIEGTNVTYNDYHFVIKNLDSSSFQSIKNKSFIDKIYIQEDDNASLKELTEMNDPFHDHTSINVYLKYKNIKETYSYSTNIIQTVGLGITDAQSKCEFNEKLLTVYGFMGANLDYTDSSQTTIMYKNVLDFSYVINIMIILILIMFSLLFIVILYNAFLITINERKREYAILNSIGATEGQILKIIFKEATIMGGIGIIIGTCLSFLGTQAILDIINGILFSTTYHFALVIKIPYLILAFLIVLINTYLSAIIPSIKASSTSIIENIRNNKQRKREKSKFFFKRLLPIEGKLALTNLKRNRNKYRIITILLVSCMTSYIAISTYILYEKETAKLATDYDVDAELLVDLSNPDYDYPLLLKDYIHQSGDNLNYIDYKILGISVLVEPEDALSTTNCVTTHEDNKKSIQIALIGLEDKEYKEYIHQINANYGDSIIGNTIMTYEKKDNFVYSYASAFNTADIKLSVVKEDYDPETESTDYQIIDDKSLTGNFVLTDDQLKGFKEFKNKFSLPTLFVNMNTYNQIAQKVSTYISQYGSNGVTWIGNDMNDPIHVKINCENIISFSHYIEDIREKQHMDFIAEYYSLANQEKIIYLAILQFILNLILLTVIIIGSISAINILNASIEERSEEFEILNRLGATKGNIRKILIYECIYMFIKATVISSIVSLPILYAIINHMKNIIIVNKLLIPFSNIAVFFVVLFALSLLITLHSATLIKINRKDRKK